MVHKTWTVGSVMNSSVWIAVLIMHVNCIIEVYPSKSSYGFLSSGSDQTNKRSQVSSSYTLHRNSAAAVTPSEESASATFSSSPPSPSYNSRQELSNLVLADRPYRGRKLSTTLLPQKLTSKSHENLSDDLTITSQSSTPSHPPNPTSTTASTSSKITTTTSATTSTTQLPSMSNSNIDSCAGKADGYYQNWGSSCTSYYFCAAGYQMTYLCPPGETFDGKKCSDEYECPEKGGFFSNPCKAKKNGYYVNPVSPSTYYYCFHQAKVIQLQCDSGKVFIGDKCVPRSLNDEHKKKNDREEDDTLPSHGITSNKDYYPTKEEVTYEIHTHRSSSPASSSSSSCSDLGNGFFPLEKSACKKYFYCINGEKTELNCQSDFVFNGDICVHNSRYTCPED